VQKAFPAYNVTGHVKLESTHQSTTATQKQFFRFQEHNVLRYRANKIIVEAINLKHYKNDY